MHPSGNKLLRIHWLTKNILSEFVVFCTKLLQHLQWMMMMMRWKKSYYIFDNWTLMVIIDVYMNDHVFYWPNWPTIHSATSPHVDVNACETLQIPKPGGIRKGWTRQFIVVCDFKLFLYDIVTDRPTPVSNVVSQVIDMRLVPFILLLQFIYHPGSKCLW